MSGGPPHHPHGRQAPASNPAWNHLQVPNYFPSRQPQHAHMSNEHPLLHQPTWHTPSTEPIKTIPQSHLFNLEQMLSSGQYSRHAPGVDLSLTRNGSQNGDLPTTPISLSVRDTNKINSLPPGALEIQAVELTKCAQKSLSPGLKPVSPGLIQEAQGSPKNSKKSNKRVDTILERLNQSTDKTSTTDNPEAAEKTAEVDKAAVPSQSVIVQAASSSHDENSNSSSILNVPTPTNREDDVVSPYSNEDSLDSSKSRRKRKPTKTVKVTKEEDTEMQILKGNEVKNSTTETAETPVTNLPPEEPQEDKKVPERRRSSSEPPVSPTMARKTRRKTSSESETIANIAAMVQETLEQRNSTNEAKKVEEEGQKVEVTKPISVSVIKTKNNLQENSESSLSPLVSQTSTPTIITAAQRKETANTHFVEVENKLEEMFAGIDDSSDPLKTDVAPLEDSRILEDMEATTSQLQDSVTSTSNELNESKKSLKRGKRKNSRRSSEAETTPKKKKSAKKSKSPVTKTKSPGKMRNKLVNNKHHKIEVTKDIYAYDSGSNASSSRSRGPFIHIRGPRDSPLSVNVINAPSNDEDAEKKLSKVKKFHDDSEYRHKVRSKGLHCSTLSNKYDAQTRDISWICVFCKRGPHAMEPKLTSLSSSDYVFNPPGDLFGPYIITTQSAEYERRLEDPYDRQFKSKKVNRALDAPPKLVSSSKKSKRKHSDAEARLSTEDNPDVYLGITDTGNGCFEVWAHEDCIVWSPGIYLIGPKIVGLEEAIWTCCNVRCARCGQRGANVCCMRRGCTNVVHHGCGKTGRWSMDEETFRAYCPEHAGTQ